MEKKNPTPEVQEETTVTPEQASKLAEEKEEKDIAGMNIWWKLLYVQKNCKAPKSQVNSYGNYNYRTTEDIFAALKPILWKVKATLFINDEIVTMPNVNGNYVKATATFVDVETGEKIETSSFAKEGSQKGMSDAQCTGSASTYARKYALNALFLLDDTRDADSMDNTTQNSDNYTQGNYQQGGYQNGYNGGYNGYQNQNYGYHNGYNG